MNTTTNFFFRLISAIIVIASMGAVAYFLFFAFIFCGNDACEMCADETISEFASPDGTYVAHAYVRDCGATTSFVTHVTLHHDSWFFGDSELLIFVAERRPDLTMTWKDDSTLEIACAECDSEKNQIFKQEFRWKNATISYEVGVENTFTEE